MTANVRDQTIMKKIREIGQCELCGSHRELQAHHIIPIVLGGDDSYENLLCVCKKCHSLLTPHKLLTKIGIRNVQYDDYYKVALYKKIQQGLEEYGGSNPTTVFDIICDCIDEL